MFKTDYKLQKLLEKHFRTKLAYVEVKGDILYHSSRRLLDWSGCEVRMVWEDGHSVLFSTSEWAYMEFENKA